MYPSGIIGQIDPCSSD